MWQSQNKTIEELTYPTVHKFVIFITVMILYHWKTPRTKEEPMMNTVLLRYYVDVWVVNFLNKVFIALD